MTQREIPNVVGATMGDACGVVPGPAWSDAHPDHRRRVLFLDRDGVVNIDHGYVHTPGKTDWVPGIFDLCAAAADVGYGLVIVTNQAGIARGYYDRARFEAYAQWVHARFEERGLRLLATYYCPHHPQAGIGELGVECGCRKPAPGMLLRAASELRIDLPGSVLLGDSPSDIAAADAAGIPLAILCRGGARAEGVGGLSGLFGSVPQ